MYKYRIKEFLGHLKKSISLGELIIALGVIGILAMILMPMLNKAKPDENEVLHKKATFIVERVVNEITTDEFLYPTGSEYTGLSNLSTVVVNGETHSGITKFCTLFASRLNKAPGTSVNCADGQKSVTSVEGIDWYLPISSFQNSDYETIKVDVNGAKGPNCMGKSNTCYHPDQFEYKIRRGTKVKVNHVGNLEATAPPAARPGMPDEPNGDTTDPRTGQKWYCIRCNAPANGTIYGFGCNKPNGHYQLVAIPNIGYKGSWFTKSVTVNNADVPESECAVTFTPIVDIPKPDGGTVNPPPTPPAPTEPEKTYCINVTKIGGDTTQCAVAGDGCGKKPGTYVVSASGKGDYKTNWTTKDVTIVDRNVSLTLSCDKEPEPEKCYSITTTGDTTSCPVTLPAGTCKTDPNKYTSGTYSYTVTPKEGYTYGGQAVASTKQIIINDKDENVQVDCILKQADTIAITYSRLEAAGATVEGVPITVSASGNLITVNGRADATISTFYVEPSNTAKPWKIQATGDDFWAGWVTSLRSGTGKQSFTTTLSRNHFAKDCLTAKYTDGSATSSSLCFVYENPVTPVKKCSITFTGQGDIGGAAVAGTVDVSGDKSETVTLNKSNNYRYRIGDLPCMSNYYFTPGCGATAGSGCMYDLTVNPTSYLPLTGDQVVTVNFALKHEDPEPITVYIRPMFSARGYSGCALTNGERSKTTVSLPANVTVNAEINYDHGGGSINYNFEFSGNRVSYPAVSSGNAVRAARIINYSVGGSNSNAVIVKQGNQWDTDIEGW